MHRDQRGVAAPSLLVMLSIIAVAMAGIAFVATQGSQPDDTMIPISARETPTPTPTVAPAPPTAPVKPRKPALDKSKVMVEVYNNSTVKGLGAQVATRTGNAGWQVVGTDNWYGTISATTVYFPARLEAAAKQLARDLGIKRVMPSIDPMRGDRLTLILTGPLAS